MDDETTTSIVERAAYISVREIQKAIEQGKSSKEAYQKVAAFLSANARSHNHLPKSQEFFQRISAVYYELARKEPLT